MSEELNFTYDEIRTFVLNKMIETGTYPKHPQDTALALDGKIHRYDIEGHKNGSRNGAYCIHPDGIPACYIQDWSKPDAKFSFNMKETGVEIKRETFDIKEWQEKKRQAEAELKRIQAEASDRAYEYYQNAVDGDFWHRYLEKKQVNAYNGVRLDNQAGKLIIPISDINGHIQTIQTINSEGEKRFFKDAPKTGNFFAIGLENISRNDTHPIFIGEGYATVAKFHEITGATVVAAIDCGNLEPVATALHSKFTKNPLIVIADNDIATEKKTGKNPGILAAQNLVNLKLAIGYIAPPFNPDKPEGSDWDDFAIIYGAEKTRKALDRQTKLMYLEIKRQNYLNEVQKLGSMNGENFKTFCNPPEGENWLIQDWLPAESLMMLFAPSGSGKGFVALDIAFAVACPHILLWHDFPIVKHGPVVYLAGEGQRGLRKRAAGLAAYKGMPLDKVDLSFIPQALPLDEKNPNLGVNRIIANIGAMAPDPALIIIDTTNRYMAGDENATKDATAFISACSQIMKEFPHSSVLIIHHTGQAQETQGRARGSSVFKAAMDMEFKISKSGSIITLEMTKSKDTEEQAPLSFRLHSVPAPRFFTATGEQETTCVLKYDEEISRINASQEKPVKISKSEKFARDTYAQAAAEYGFLIKDIEGRETVALNVEDWRKVFYMKSAGDSEGVRRVQFNRARKLLLEETNALTKKIINGNECYCLIPDGSTYESEIISSIIRTERQS